MVDTRPIHANEAVDPDHRQEDLALAIVLATLLRFKKQARPFVAKAWAIGRARALVWQGRSDGELTPREWQLINEEIARFDRLVDTVYAPAWLRSLVATRDETELEKVSQHFEDRIGNYADYLWGVAQVAFRESLPQDTWVDFVGPEDEKNCPGCAEAVRKGPYRVQEAPRPGSFECHANCRHELRVVEAPLAT